LSSIHQWSINYVGKVKSNAKDNCPYRRNRRCSSCLAGFRQTNSEMEAQELQNPADNYSKPSYKKQSQPWPGLASQMDPRPDHGEKSYRGSGRLAGRNALITGRDSGMGRAAAIACAREGADVAINYFPTEEPDAKDVIELIKAQGRIWLAIPGDLIFRWNKFVWSGR
jgi:ribosome modulation factor